MVATSPDATRVVTALARYVSGHAAPPPGLVPVQAVAVVKNGRATLVPTLLDEHLQALSRQLDRRGQRVLDVQTLHLDLERHEVVVGMLADIDGNALAAAASLAPSPRRADPPVPDGRYPIERWMLMEFWDRPGPYSRGTATRRAALVVRGGPRTAGPRALDRLAELFTTVPAEGIDPQSRREVLDLLRPAR